MDRMTVQLGWSTAGRRAGATLGDFVVIAGWIAGLTVAGVAVRALLPGLGGGVSPAEMLPVFDVAAFAGTVLPVGIYLSVTEAGPRQATWGKRWRGMWVTTAAGDAPGLARTVARNAVKLLPWQLGHLAVSRIIAGVDVSPAIWTAYGLALVIPVVSVALALGDPSGRALHDRVARTRVVASTHRDRSGTTRDPLVAPGDS